MLADNGWSVIPRDWSGVTSYVLRIVLGLTLALQNTTPREESTERVHEDDSR